jgi:hypothetical protein
LVIRHILQPLVRSLLRLAAAVIVVLLLLLIHLLALTSAPDSESVSKNRIPLMTSSSILILYAAILNKLTTPNFDGCV